MDRIVILLDFEFVKGFHLNQSSTVWPLNETEEALGNRSTFRRDQVVESLRSFGTAWPPPGCVRSPILKRFGALEACERWCRIATLTSSKMKSGAANHSEWDHIANIFLMVVESADSWFFFWQGPFLVDLEQNIGFGSLRTSREAYIVGQSPRS